MVEPRPQPSFTPTLPSPYHTTEQVRNGISLAYSNFNNPRGLEKMWNAPWLGTVNGLVAPYDGPFTVHSEYPMFIPSLIVKDLNLRRSFEENGLDYHDINDGQSSDDSESDEEDILPAVHSHEGERRQSARIPVLERRAKQRGEKRQRDVEKALRKERVQLRLDQSEAKEEGRKLSHGMTCTIAGFCVSREGFLCRKLLLQQCGYYARRWS